MGDERVGIIGDGWMVWCENAVVAAAVVLSLNLTLLLSTTDVDLVNNVESRSYPVMQ